MSNTTVERFILKLAEDCKRQIVLQENSLAFLNDLINKQIAVFSLSSFCIDSQQQIQQQQSKLQLSPPMIVSNNSLSSSSTLTDLDLNDEIIISAANVQKKLEKNLENTNNKSNHKEAKVITEELQKTEKLIFDKNEYVEQIRIHIDVMQRKIKKEIDNNNNFNTKDLENIYNLFGSLSKLEVDDGLKTLEQLESKRNKLLHSYWEQYYKINWPDSGASKLYNNNSRENYKLSSPSTQQAVSGLNFIANKNVNTISKKRKRNNSHSSSSEIDLKTSEKTKKLLSIVNSGKLSEIKGNRSKDHSPCNCKKSKCLKLYCECFANGKFCQDCHCLDCKNIPSYETLRKKAIESILIRRPDAFGININNNSNENQNNARKNSKTASKDELVKVRSMQGCNCRRTHCLKKYCVCFNDNIPCSAYCRCENCLNDKKTGNSDDDL